ncbi:MAG TPA: HNH endonuclease signature motif containing protein [Anaerolineae bacterium]|nr:HNH endonuclease signature motif containing protein [Anaerolineae bacterium]
MVAERWPAGGRDGVLMEKLSAEYLASERNTKLKNVMCWLGQCIYNRGEAERCLSDSRPGTYCLDYNIAKKFGKIGWRWANGCHYVRLGGDYRIAFDLREHMVWGRGGINEWPVEDALALVQSIDLLIQGLLPGIEVGSTLSLCDACNRLNVCRLVADHLVCDRCEDVFLLAEPKVSSFELPGVKDERAKMTVSLRYHVLELGQFMCRVCGRGPLDGDNVKLHVDHIVPIVAGGKTVLGNLQVLCADCNLGKGTQRSPQMEAAQLAMAEAY